MNVVFDFDKTLTRKDTTRPFIFFIARERGMSPAAYLLYYGLYRLKIWNERRFKTALVQHYLAGLTVPEGEDLARRFLDWLADGQLKTSTVTALEDHLRKGDVVHVASANFDILIRTFCQTRNIPHYFATTLDVDGGRFTGVLSGPIVKGAAKLEKLRDHFGAEFGGIRFYGDAEDRVLLDAIPDHVEVQ